MRRFNTLRLGVEKGEQVLFTDFQDGGEMWTGHGLRKREVPITFGERFLAPPIVQVSMSMWDVHHAANMRMDTSAEKITEKGFTILFQTWGDTRVARVRVNWMAIGELHDDDLWDV